MRKTLESLAFFSKLCYNNNMKKYYDVLGIAEGSSLQKARNARNKLLKKYHPDMFDGDPEFAQTKTFEINEAYQKISEHIKQQEKVLQNKSEVKSSSEGLKESAQNKTASQSKQKTKASGAKQKTSAKTSKKHSSQKNNAGAKKQQVKPSKQEARKQQTKFSKQETQEVEPQQDNNEKQSGEKGLKLFLDCAIFGLIALLIVLLILFFTGVIR